MENTLTAAELDERVAVLRRFRSLLEAQRDKFREYLSVLEKQQLKIEADDSEALMAHAELETQIVANIASLQKVIVPMQALYERAVPSGAADDGRGGVARLQDELGELQRRVLAQNERNRLLLKAQLSSLRTQINDLCLKNPYRGRRSVYAEKALSGSMFAAEA